MRGRTAQALAFAFALSTASPFAQGAPETKPSFEVASIKPNKDPRGGGWSSSGGRQTIIGTTTSILIGYAFELHDYEMVGAPKWVLTDRLDVIAQAEGHASDAEYRLMMQSLLEERFALKAHRETREGSKYRLSLSRKDGTLGPQLIKSDIDCAELRRRGEQPPASQDLTPWDVTPCGMRVAGGEMAMGARLFSDFVGFLESLVNRRIENETGLSGPFNIKLEWSRGQDDVNRPSIFTAVQEQLGLRLEPTSGAINVLVIDSISRPTPD